MVTVGRIISRIWEVEDIEKEWAGAPIVVPFYAKRTGPIGPDDDYAVLHSGSPPVW